MTEKNDVRDNAAQVSSHIAADQSEVAAWLSDPTSYGPEVKRVERIDTHGAMVFLAGDRAYKIKRAVHYPYMDFSTLELRRAACEREVSLNRRTAPDLYIAAEPIVRVAGGLSIGGAGQAIEWVIIMRRFDEDGLCDRLAQKNRLTPDLMAALADEIAKLHDGAEAVYGSDAPGGGASGIRAVIAENAAELTERPDLFPDAGALESASLSVLRNVATLLDARFESGLVRRCHGDLHLRNICVIDGHPTIFDCIEFNDAISCIDVLYDLAFLLMDLEHRGLRALANVVLNRYQQCRGDIAGMAALPLFLSVRAAVRAKVSVSMAAAQDDRSAVIKLHKEAQAYEAAARAFLDPTPPRLVAVGGLSGTGKTSLAKLLAPDFGAAPGALHLRSDVLRKALAGVGELTRLPNEAYTAPASRRVYAALVDLAREALEAGRAVIVDAVYAKPEERAAIESLATALRVPFDGMWLEAPPEVMVARVEDRESDASDATASVVRAQQRYDLGKVTWTRIDAARGRDAMATEARRILLPDQINSG